MLYSIGEKICTTRYLQDTLHYDVISILKLNIEKCSFLHSEHRPLHIPDAKRNHQNNDQDRDGKPHKSGFEFLCIGGLFFCFGSSYLRNDDTNHHSHHVLYTPKSLCGILHRSTKISHDVFHHR